MTVNSSVIARRQDGMGFLIGTLVRSELIHNHKVYVIRTVRGVLQKVPATQYLISPR